MKADTNLDNRDRFEALYWGQSVGVIYSDSREPVQRGVIVYGQHFSYLELKPLSSISDEDAIEVAKIHFQGPEFLNGMGGRQIAHKGRFLIRRWIKSSFWKSDVVDFLRSRGYLLPWMGLSCEEIIAEGWAKYKPE